MKDNIKKELKILLLLFIAVGFTVFVALFDFFSFNKKRLSSIEYKADENTKSVIEEIRRNSAIFADEEKLLRTFTVDKSDLINDDGTGKQDPFAEISEPATKETK